MEQSDYNELKNAKNILENTSFAEQVVNVLGKPIEESFKKLPEGWNNKVAKYTQKALTKSLDSVMLTMKLSNKKKPWNKMHKFTVMSTGAVGGFYGLPGLSVELPVSTTIMLRSIADIARHQEEDLSKYETKLSCIEVFALGEPASSDNIYDSKYYAVRANLAIYLNRAADKIIKNGLNKTNPYIFRLIAKISERYSIQVTEKAAAQASPIIGAAGGFSINGVFINHFQKKAQGHFTVRRLERKYGKDNVKEAYDNITDI